jgi:ABC-type molybdate transport system permease subunit
MKIKIGIAIGIGIGTAIYEAIRHGIYEIAWTRVVFISLISFLVLLFIPKRAFEKEKAEHGSPK